MAYNTKIRELNYKLKRDCVKASTQYVLKVILQVSDLFDIDGAWLHPTYTGNHIIVFEN